MTAFLQGDGVRRQGIGLDRDQGAGCVHPNVLAASESTGGVHGFAGGSDRSRGSPALRVPDLRLLFEGDGGASPTRPGPETRVNSPGRIADFWRRALRGTRREFLDQAGLPVGPSSRSNRRVGILAPADSEDTGPDPARASAGGTILDVEITPKRPER